MIADIEHLIERYHLWLRDKSVLRQIDSWVEITTPFLDRHNDYVQIYAKKEDGTIVLSDDGYTIDDLEQSGCKLESRKRQELLRMTLNGFGVQLNGKALSVRASEDNFAVRKHNLLQAILAVNDLFYLSTPTVTSLFYEDVVEWLDNNDIRYTPKVKLAGKTGYDHVFDFVIPKSRFQPERIVQAINKPSRDSAQSVVLAWVDTKDTRSSDSRVYALINDNEQAVSREVLEALNSYYVKPFAWSNRAELIAELAA